MAHTQVGLVQSAAQVLGNLLTDRDGVAGGHCMSAAGAAYIGVALAWPVIGFASSLRPFFDDLRERWSVDLMLRWAPFDTAATNRVGNKAKSRYRISFLKILVKYPAPNLQKRGYSVVTSAIINIPR